MDPIVCHHCSESAQSSGGLLCFCGVPVTCDMCDGAGCRCCGRWGWFSVLEAEERAAEDADELNGWSWDNARHERAEAREDR